MGYIAYILLVAILVFVGCGTEQSKEDNTPKEGNTIVSPPPPANKVEVQTTSKPVLQETTPKQGNLTHESVAQDNNSPQNKTTDNKLPVVVNEQKKDYTFDDIISLQKRIVADKPNSEAERKKLAMLYILSEHFIEAEEILSKLNSKDELIDVNIAYLYNILGEHKTAENRLRKVLDGWEKAGSISVEKVELCESVSGYRQYKPYGRDNSIKPGSPILLYVEPKNFQLNKEGDKYIMHLKYNWELYNDRGQIMKVSIWDSVDPRVREETVEFRDITKEFHQTFRLPLPKNLSMGKYAVKVTVEDVNSGKSASNSIDINITDF